MTGEADEHAPVSTVVFDLGNVLLDWDPTYVIGRDDVVALDIDGVQRQLDQGVAVDQVRARWRADHATQASTIDRYFDAWDRTVAGPIDGTVAILDDLRTAGLRLYVLSNFSGTLFRRIRHRFPFLDWFDGLVISGDEGVIKPDAAIYRLLIDRYDLVPRRTVFIDDRPENVEAGRAAGLLGIEFTTAAALRAQLQNLAVI